MKKIPCDKHTDILLCYYKDLREIIMFFLGIHKKMISLLGEHVQIVEVYGSTELGIISSVPGDREKTLGLLGYLEAGASLYIQVGL